MPNVLARPRRCRGGVCLLWLTQASQVALSDSKMQGVPPRPSIVRSAFLCRFSSMRWPPGSSHVVWSRFVSELRVTIKRTPVPRPPRTNIPWVRSDHHDCPDKRSSKKSLRIRADGYAKCFRCGWKGWLDGPQASPRQIERARAKQKRYAKVFQKILDECEPIGSDSPVSRYLASRHLTQDSPKDLLYHPALMHGPSKTKWPAMVAILRTRHGQQCGIHRTYLTAAGEKAPVSPQRMVLGDLRGAGFHAEMLPAMCGGQPVYTGNHRQPRTVVCVCEGIEDALALRLAHTGWAAWATVSASNMATNEPPDAYGYVMIYPDRDLVGEQAGKQLYDLLRSWGWQTRLRWLAAKDPAEAWAEEASAQ